MRTDRTDDFNERKSDSHVADVAEEMAIAVVPLVCSLERLHYVADADSIREYHRRNAKSTSRSCSID